MLWAWTGDRVQHGTMACSSYSVKIRSREIKTVNKFVIANGND